jgi:hypothetical protein
LLALKEAILASKGIGVTEKYQLVEEVKKAIQHCLFDEVTQDEQAEYADNIVDSEYPNSTS